MGKKKNGTIVANEKVNDLQSNTQNGNGQMLSTNQGLLINDNQNSLKAGEKGCNLIGGFYFA
jgi:catalase